MKQVKDIQLCNLIAACKSIFFIKPIKMELACFLQKKRIWSDSVECLKTIIPNRLTLVQNYISVHNCIPKLKILNVVIYLNFVQPDI